MGTLNDASLPTSRQRWGTSFRDKQHVYSFCKAARDVNSAHASWDLWSSSFSQEASPITSSLRGWLPSSNFEGHLRTGNLIYSFAPPSTYTLFAKIAWRVGIYGSEILLNSLKMLSHWVSMLYHWWIALTWFYSTRKFSQLPYGANKIEPAVYFLHVLHYYC